MPGSDFGSFLPSDMLSTARSYVAGLQVIPSRIEGEVKVSGVLGAAAPLDKKGPAVGDQAVGMGGTTAWKLASLVTSSPHPHLLLSPLSVWLQGAQCCLGL